MVRSWGEASHREEVEATPGNNLIGYSLSDYIVESLVCCCDLLSFGFNFLTLRDCRLRFCFAYKAAKALKPPQPNGLLFCLI